MNERFKELSKQAIIATRAENSPELPPLDDALVEKILELTSAQNAKFAELIVRECKLQIADVRIENNFEPVSDAALTKALVGINEHFGIYN